MLGLLVVSAGIRFWAIGSEPFWLDEVFSHDYTGGTVAETMILAAGDTHPPLYFLGLRSWRLLAADSPAAERSYSTVWSLLGVLLLVALIHDLTGRWDAGLAGGLLAAANPLDVYFAQETRMYTQAATLGLLTTWLLVRWLKARQRADGGASWPWLMGYTAAGVALLGTHYVTVTILLAQGLLLLGWQISWRDWRGVRSYLVAAATCALAFLPWVVHVLSLRGSLFNPARAGWIPGPTVGDVWLLVSHDLILGRARLGGVWPATIAAVGLWVFVVVRLIDHRPSSDGGSSDGSGPPEVVLAWMLGAPVALALLVSVVWHPVFFRPRFAMLVLPYFLGLVALACFRRPGGRARAVPLALVVALMLSASVSETLTIQKTGLAEFAALWRSQGPPDYVLFYPRWNRRVAGYYLGEPVLNVPSRTELERALHHEHPLRLWICTRHGSSPDVPSGELAEYRWALSLGPHHLLGRLDRVEDVIEVQAEPLRRSYPQLPADGSIDFTSPAAERYLWSGWYPAEKRLRWTRGTRAEVVFSLGDSRPSTLEIELGCFRRQHITALVNGTEIARLECSERAPHLLRLAIPEGVLQSRNSLVLQLPDATRPSEVRDSHDSRRLALAVRSLALRD